MIDIVLAFLKTTAGTITSLLVNSLMIKIIAVTLGPQAVGFLAILRQIHSTSLSVATLSGQSALVQGGAKLDAHEKNEYLATVLLLFCLSCGLTIILLLFFAPFWASQLIGSSNNTPYLFFFLALAILFTVLNSYSLGVLNIHRYLGIIATIQIVGAVANLAITYPVVLLVSRGGNWYLALLIMFGPLVMFNVSVFSLWRLQLLQPIVYNIWQKFNKIHAYYFYSFAGITSFTTIFQGLTMLLTRFLIIQYQGLEANGLFEATWMLSMTYITLITTAFSTYYLPTLSASSHTSEKNYYFQNMFHFSVIMSTVAVLIVVVLKPLVVELLFSEQFSVSLGTIRWMLIGDFFKVTSWVMAYTMLAFTDLRTYFWSEMLFHSAFLAGTAVSIIFFQTIEGIGLTFCVLYALYFLAMYLYVQLKHALFIRLPLRLIWLLGLILIITISALTWQETTISSRSILYLLFFSALFTAANLGLAWHEKRLA